MNALGASDQVLLTLAAAVVLAVLLARSQGGARAAEAAASPAGASEPPAALHLLLLGSAACFGLAFLGRASLDEGASIVARDLFAIDARADARPIFLSDAERVDEGQVLARFGAPTPLVLTAPFAGRVGYRSAALETRPGDPLLVLMKPGSVVARVLVPDAVYGGLPRDAGGPSGLARVRIAGAAHLEGIEAGAPRARRLEDRIGWWEIDFPFTPTPAVLRDVAARRAVAASVAFESPVTSGIPFRMGVAGLVVWLVLLLAAGGAPASAEAPAQIAARVEAGQDEMASARAGAPYPPRDGPAPAPAPAPAHRAVPRALSPEDIERDADGPTPPWSPAATDPATPSPSRSAAPAPPGAAAPARSRPIRVWTFWDATGRTRTEVSFASGEAHASRASAGTDGRKLERVTLVPDVPQAPTRTWTVNEPSGQVMAASLERSAPTGRGSTPLQKGRNVPSTAGKTADTPPEGTNRPA